MWDLFAKVWDKSPLPVESESNVNPTSVSDSGRAVDQEKNASATGTTNPTEPTDSDVESLNSSVQGGVHEIEAVATAWTTPMLWTAYVL